MGKPFPKARLMTDKPRVHLNWTIPVPMILTILLTALGGIWQASTWVNNVEANRKEDRAKFEGLVTVLSMRVEALERQRVSAGEMAERMKGVEVKVEVLKDQTSRIESKIDKMAERGGDR